MHFPNQYHSGTGDNIAGDKIVNNFYCNSSDYALLQARISELEDDLNHISDKSGSFAIKKSELLHNARLDLLKFEEEVVRTAAFIISNKDIDSERLKRASECFENGELQEAIAILDEALMITEQKRLVSAKEFKQKELELLEKKLKQNSTEFLFLARLASIDFSKPDRFEKTKGYFEMSLRSERNTGNLFDYGYFLNEYHFKKEAQSLYEECIDIYRSLNKRSFEDEINLSITLNNLANLYSEIGEFESAVLLYEEALSLRRGFVNLRLDCYLYFLGGTLDRMGNLFVKMKNFQMAHSSLQESLNIFRELNRIDSETYLPYLGFSITSMAIFQKSQGDFDNAFTLYQESISIKKKLVEINPTLFGIHLVNSLDNLANLSAEKSDIENAIQLYEESIKLLNQIVIYDPIAYLPELSYTFIRLGNLYISQNDPKAAILLYENSLKIRREIALNNPKNFLPNIASDLIGLAKCYKMAGNYELSHLAYEESLNIYEKLNNDTPNMYLRDIALGLNDLGILLTQKGDCNLSLPFYEKSFEIFKGLAVVNPQKYLPDLSMISINLATYYTICEINKDKSLHYVKEGIKSGFPFINELSKIEEYIQNASQIILRWGIDIETFIKDNFRE